MCITSLILTYFADIFHFSCSRNGFCWRCSRVCMDECEGKEQEQPVISDGTECREANRENNGQVFGNENLIVVVVLILHHFFRIFFSLVVVVINSFAFFGVAFIPHPPLAHTAASPFCLNQYRQNRYKNESWGNSPNKQKKYKAKQPKKPPTITHSTLKSKKDKSSEKYTLISELLSST